MAQEFVIALGSNLGSDLGAGAAPGKREKGAPFRSEKALGTALGPADTLAVALAAMPRHGITVRRVSRFFATPCFPAGAGPDYVNACAAVHVTRSAEHVNPRAIAEDFLRRLHAIEAEFGRERVQRWGSRTLDLDLVAMGDSVLPDLASWKHWADLPPEEQLRATPDRLILPHPRMHERAFVLVPLRDIAAGWTHPILRQNVAELASALPAALQQEVIPLGA